MARRHRGTNPFYMLLVIAGIAFAITAVAYGVMAYRAVAPRPSETPAASEHRLTEFLDDYGVALMAGELALLAVATFAAMGTDSYWTRRGGSRDERKKY